MQLDSRRALWGQSTPGHFSAPLEVLLRRHLHHLRHLHLHHLRRRLLRHLHLLHAMWETAWTAMHMGMGMRCVLGISVALMDTRARQQTTPSRVVLHLRHSIVQLRELWFEL